MSQSSKAKGRRHQKQVKSILHDHFPSLDDGDIDWQSMGSGGQDIILSPRAKEMIPFAIECKYGQQPPWQSGFDQAEENAKDEQIPLYVRRKPYEDNLAVLKFEDLLRLKSIWTDEDDETLSKIKDIVC